MYCVKDQQSQEEIIKKSRFIGVIFPCHTEQEGQQNLKHLSAEHVNATHIAYAYRIKTDHGLIYRFHDADEPSGTAGKPIFQQLEGKQLVNVLIAVIRYYGGIKLGAGGLTRAYGQAARNAIEVATLYPYIEWVEQLLILDYKELQPLEYLLKKLNGRIISQDFTEQVKVIVQIPAEQVHSLLQAFPATY